MKFQVATKHEIKKRNRNAVDSSIGNDEAQLIALNRRKKTAKTVSSMRNRISHDKHIAMPM